MTTGDGVSQGAGGRCSEDLFIGDGSSYTGCLLKISDAVGLRLESRGTANEVGSEFSRDPSALYASPLR